MVRSAQVALVAVFFGLLAAPPSVYGQRGGEQTEGRGGGSSGGGSSSSGGGGRSGGGSSLGGSSLSGGSTIGGATLGGTRNSGGGNSGSSRGGVTVGSNNGNGNNGNGNGGNNGNGNTVVTGGVNGNGNQVGGQGNQQGGQGNQGGTGNVNQGGGGVNQNQQGGGGSQSTGPVNTCFVNGIAKLNCAKGNSDPIMTGFAGRSFNFFGDVGKNYNLLTEAHHQLAMHLKLARLHDHNGTNMDHIGLQYKSYKVEMAINAADEVTVAVNDKLLPPKDTLQTHAWRFSDGSMAEMSWEQHRIGLGNTVVFTTDTLEITSWFVPAGIPEPGHEENVLGSYLNFNITLMGSPVDNHMEGIIGETYQRYTAGLAAISDPNNTALYAANDGAWKGQHPIQQYEMANLWDVKFPLTLFNSTVVAAPRERSQLELEVAFPVVARGCQHCVI